MTSIRCDQDVNFISLVRWLALWICQPQHTRMHTHGHMHAHTHMKACNGTKGERGVLPGCFDAAAGTVLCSACCWICLYMQLTMWYADPCGQPSSVSSLAQTMAASSASTAGLPSLPPSAPVLKQPCSANHEQRSCQHVRCFPFVTACVSRRNQFIRNE